MKRLGRGDKLQVIYTAELHNMFKPALYFDGLQRQTSAAWRQGTENSVFGNQKDNKAEIKGR